MGLACGTICSRERSNDNNHDDPEFAQQVFLTYLETTRNQGSAIQARTFVVTIQGIKPVSQFDNIVTSASNYWTNRQNHNVTGSRRPVVTYNIDSRNHLFMKHNSVFTKQELNAVIKISRWWHKILQVRKRQKLLLKAHKL